MVKSFNSSPCLHVQISIKSEHFHSLYVHFAAQSQLGDRGGRRAKRDNTRYLPPKHPSVKSLHRNVIQVHRTLPPPATHGRQNKSSKPWFKHSTVKPCKQTSSSTSFSHIYIYIIYNHKNLYVQLIWQEIKWATLSKLHFVLFWGDFYHRDQILCRCWNVVKPLAMYDVTREGTCFTAYVCVVSVSAIVSHSLEKAAEMKENLNLFRQDRTPTGTRCGRTVKNRQEGSEQRQK